MLYVYFHSCQVIYNVALPLHFTFYSLSDMQDAVHIMMMMLDIVTNLQDRLFSQGYKDNRLRNSFQTIYGRYLDLFAKYQRSMRNVLNDKFPL